MILRQLFLLSFLATLAVSSYAADERDNAPQSAYDRFLSNKGTMITKDYEALSEIKSNYQLVSPKVVRLSSNKGTKYFLRLSIKAKYGEKQAIILSDELAEVQKALVQLSSKAADDATQNLSYREAYFETNDGFKIGYYQEKKKQTFFINLDDYQSDDSVFFNNFSDLEKVIDDAIVKIQSMGG